MAQQQLGHPSGWVSCDICLKAFANRSNRRRHMVAVHHIGDGRTCSVTSDSSEFPLRCAVTGIVEELITGNSTRPVPELLATISQLAPDFTPRESEILLAATASTARWVAGTALSLGTLWRQGGPASAAERDLERRLTYLHVGPSRSQAASSLTAPHTSPPASVVSAGDCTTQWLVGVMQEPVPQQPLHGDGGVELMEVTAEPPPSSPPPPPSLPCIQDCPATAPLETLAPDAPSGGATSRALDATSTASGSRAGSLSRRSPHERDRRSQHAGSPASGFSRESRRPRQPENPTHRYNERQRHRGASPSHYHKESRHHDDIPPDRHGTGHGRPSRASPDHRAQPRRRQGDNESLRRGNEPHCCSGGSCRDYSRSEKHR